jgi:DNA invertase Pin-like site-specific DNA recombinase
LDNRPALLELFESLAADGIKLVLIEKLDRLARDLMVQENILADLNKRGFELVSVTEPDLLQKDPARVLMRQIFGAIAQYDKAMIVAKLRAARQRTRAAKGYCEGRKPYGYRPGEAEVVARILRLRRDGVVLEKIADQLNAEAVRRGPGSGGRRLRFTTF